MSGKKLKEKLEEFKDQALMSKELATIMTDAPIEVSVSGLEYQGFNREQVIAIFKDLGFNTLLERLGEDSEEAEQDQALEEIKVETVTDVTSGILVSPSAFVVEQIGDNYHEEPLLGFSIVNETGSYFIPKDIAVESEVFKEWAENDEQKKWLFDSKRAVVALRWQGIELKGAEFDTLLAAYIINPGNSYDDVASVAKDYGLHIVSSDESVYGKGAKRAVPSEDVLSEHLVRKALAIQSLRKSLFRSWRTTISLNCLKSSKCRLRLFSAKWNQLASRSMLIV